MFGVKHLPETLRDTQTILYAPEPRYPTEAEPELCLRVSCGGPSQQWPASGVGALGAVDLGVA